MYRTFAFIVTLVGFGLAQSAPVLASLPPAAPAAIASYQSGSLHVDEYGTAGKPAIVFIPGLTCGPWVWNGEIAQFAPAYHIYALTLPGFDGNPTLAKSPYFDRVASDFWALMSDKHIDKPILIGHSLGGTTAFLLATMHPERLRAIAAVDGLPAFPGFEKMPMEQRRAAVGQMAAQMAQATPAQFLASEKTYVLPELVTAQSDVDAVAPLVAKSSPAATAQWFKEDVLLDLRPSLAKATLPILEIAPFDATLDTKPPMSLASPAIKQQYYQSIVANAPNAHVVMIPNSRHFIMYDQPAALHTQLAAFISSLPPM